MTGKPLVVETLQVVPRLPPWQVKEMQKEIGEESMTAFTIMWHSSAVCDVLHIEENARMNLISKKINWLEDDSYPADRPEKHWLVWFHKLSRVEGASVVCMKCRATPEQVPNTRKLVRDVLHISEENQVPIVKGRTPLPLANNPFFLCLDCAGTARDSGIGNHGRVGCAERAGILPATWTTHGRQVHECQPTG
jgi:hypothetical protein